MEREAKRQIDRLRDSAGSAKIPGDFGNIVTMKAIASRLYFLAERGLTSSVMADQIDPERMNPNIPQVVQRTELEYGATADFIQRTLCVAFELVEQTHLPDHVKADEILAIAVEVASALAAVIDTSKEMQTHQAQLRATQLSAAHLPRFQNLTGKIKQCLAHLRDVENSIKQMILKFYPNSGPGKSWDKELSPAMEIYCKNDQNILKTFNSIKELIISIGDHRNAMIHPDNTKRCIIFDYELEAQGAIVAPSIQIEHERSPLSRRDAAQFLELQVASVLMAYEAFLAWLCDLNAKNTSQMFESRVVTLPAGELSCGSRVVWQTVLKTGYELPKSDSKSDK